MTPNFTTAGTPQTAALWQPYPPRPMPQRTGQIFADAPLNQNRYWGGYNPHGFNQPRGYGLDLNGDGKFDSKKDGYLSFDFNRDGKHTDQEIQHSRNLLKAFSGDFDLNGDRQVDFGEMMQGYSNFFQARQMDMDGDGVLSKWELQKAGASVVQRGQVPMTSDIPGVSVPAVMVDGWRSLGLDSLPGSRSLDYVNPWNRTFGTSRNDLAYIAARAGGPQ